MRVPYSSGAWKSRAVRAQGAHWALTRGQLWATLLGLLALLSAFALVYIKDYNRRLFIEQQILERQYQIQVNQWSQLLLEQSAWAAQSRIQQVATEQLNMRAPVPSDIVIIE